ncbi:hypothetical protein J6590_067117 [Homalodisca vitripennis]|nr:hypothetical protein J6590_067117 [Homalodisca vitripennis]
MFKPLLAQRCINGRLYYPKNDVSLVSVHNNNVQEYCEAVKVLMLQPPIYCPNYHQN